MKKRLNITLLMSTLVLLMLLSSLPHHHHDGATCFDSHCLINSSKCISEIGYNENHENDHEEECSCCVELIYILGHYYNFNEQLNIHALQWKDSHRVILPITLNKSHEIDALFRPKDLIERFQFKITSQFISLLCWRAPPHLFFS